MKSQLVFIDKKFNIDKAHLEFPLCNKCNLQASGLGAQFLGRPAEYQMEYTCLENFNKRDARKFSRYRSEKLISTSFHEDLLVLRFFLDGEGLLANITTDPFSPQEIWSTGCESKVLSLLPFCIDSRLYEGLYKEHKQRFEYKTISLGSCRDEREHAYVIPVINNRVCYSLTFRLGLGSNDAFVDLLKRRVYAKKFGFRDAKVHLIQLKTLGNALDKVASDGFANFTWRKLDVLNIDLVNSAAEIVMGAKNVIAQHQPLLVVRNQVEGSALLDFEMENFGYIKACQKNSILTPCDGKLQGAYCFYISKLKVSQYQRVGLYSDRY